MLRRIVSSLRVYIYIYIYRFFHRLTSPGVTSGRDQGCREEESRKFNFDHHGGEEYMDGGSRTIAIRLNAIPPFPPQLINSILYAR